jgi:hypothetical protein
MMSYWTNFARKGDPVLHLDNPITSRPDENRGRYEFWRDSDQ